MAEGLSQFGVGQQLLHRFGQLDWIVRGDEQTRLAMLDYLRDSHQVRGNNRHSHGHGFEQYRRQCVAVSGRADDTRKDKEAGPLQSLNQLLLRLRSGEHNTLLQTQAGNLAGQSFALRPFAHDLAAKGLPLVPQVSASFDEPVETLFLLQATDRQNETRFSWPC